MVSKKVETEEKAQDYGAIRLFVYGTLKKHHGNHGLLVRAKARFIGYDKIIVPKAAFMDLGNFPALITDIVDTKESQTICGELWYGSPEMLKSVDILEGHPNFYRRQKVWTEIHRKRAWVYGLPEGYIAHGEDFLEETMWRPTDDEKAFWEGQDDNRPTA